MASSSNFTSYVSWDSDQPLVILAGQEKLTETQQKPVIGTGTNTNENLLVNFADEPNSTSPTQNVLNSENGEYKTNQILCGYLNKLKDGARGKNFKRRWFVYSENTCKLLYYRTPQDIVPLGEIEIANAALTFEIPETSPRQPSSGPKRANMFEISTGDKVYHLEAADQQTMMYWLQQLQIKRRNFSHQKMHSSSDKSSLKSVQEPSGGLLGKSPISGDCNDVSLPMTPVECPHHSVGEGAASTQSRNPLADISISNWKTEIRNALANIKVKRNSGTDTSLTPSPQPSSPTPQSDAVSSLESGSRLSTFQNFKRRIKSKNQDMDSPGVNWSGSSESLCSQCRMLEGVVNHYKEEVQRAEEETLATHELLRIQQKDIDLLHRKMKTQSMLQDEGPYADYVSSLQLKDKTIVNLEHLVATIKEEKEIENVQLKMLESKVVSLEEDLEMYHDSLRSKDEVVVALTNQIYDMEKKLSSVNTNNAWTNTTLTRKPVDTLEIERLRDALSAYQIQNRFLNKEILELSKLRANDEAQHKDVFMQCADWEAKYYQINSKYLLCLDQLRTPRMVTNDRSAGSADFADLSFSPPDLNGPNETFDRNSFSRSSFKRLAKFVCAQTQKLKVFADQKKSAEQTAKFHDDTDSGVEENIYVIVDLFQNGKTDIGADNNNDPVVISCVDVSDSESESDPENCLSKPRHPKQKQIGSIIQDLIVRFQTKTGGLSQNGKTLVPTNSQASFVDSIFIGLDAVCRFLFLQVALFQNSDTTICLMCDTEGIIGHSLCVDNTQPYVLSADINKMVLTIIHIKGGEAAASDMVQQLLDDAIGESANHTDLLTSQSLEYSISKQRLTKKYDKYGFAVWSDSGDDLVEKANTMQRMTNKILDKDVDKEISQNVQWENLFASLRNRELSRTQELKNLIRNGIPYQHREKVWNACISFRVGKLRQTLGPQYYQNLLEQVQQQSHRHNPAAKQIELDLLRTLPNNCHYETMSSDGTPKLKRVLRAYTQHNPDLGYCQGQNRLAAIALLFLNEEDAFWCLVAITEYLMPQDYYSRTLSAAQVDQRVFKDLMTDKMPQLMSHIENLDLDLSLFTFNWFLTIFIDNIPTETYLRVWDSFLYEGNKVLFRFALAFFKYQEKELMSIRDNLSLHNFLRTLGENSTDVNRIAELAFQSVNPLPMRHIETRRQFHMVQVKSELAELEALRSRFRSTRREKRHPSADFVSDDES